MTNTAYEALGEERIERIFQEHKLTSEDGKAIKDILDEWDDLVGQTEKKIEVVAKILKNKINHKNVISAILQINLEFVEKVAMKE